VSKEKSTKRLFVEKALKTAKTPLFIGVLVKPNIKINIFFEKTPGIKDHNVKFLQIELLRYLFFDFRVGSKFGLPGLNIE
jgi:hypothetical protein